MCNCGGNKRPQVNTNQAGHRAPQRPPMTVYNSAPTPNYVPPTPQYPNYPYHTY